MFQHILSVLPEIKSYDSFNVLFKLRFAVTHPIPFVPAVFFAPRARLVPSGLWRRLRLCKDSCKDRYKLAGP